MTEDSLSGHSGELAVAVARAHGVETMFTLSGAHVFPMYDGAVKAEPPMRLVDVRHEQTAAFAAEATGKLTRVPGLAVLTAGPGVTNGLSAVAQAQFAGSPMVVVGGRAPAARWGSGSLQEIDQPPILAPITKQARTLHTADDVLDGIHDAFVAGRLAAPRSHLRRHPPRRVLQQRLRSAAHREATTAAPNPTATRSPRSPSCSPPRPDRSWSSAPTSGPTARRTRRCASSSPPASPRSPTAWAAGWSPAGTHCW